jgi:glucose-1-phosphate cytidylyltransferase
MKAVILAGGRGTRLSEETILKPKPLVEAGGHPLLWHIMQNYARFGVIEFVILVGYKGHLIREYFADYWLHQSDITFELNTPNLEIHRTREVPWKVTVVETGIDTETAGRLYKARHHLEDTFLLTYGDGVADVNIGLTIEAHVQSGNLVTLTAVQPPARFGALQMSDSLQITSFQEKPTGDGAWINGGYFVVNPKVFTLIGDRDCSFESQILPEVSAMNKLGAYKHDGFWQPVDTVRDLHRLEEAISENFLPWNKTEGKR